jgi:hypothetical protein
MVTLTAAGIMFLLFTWMCEILRRWSASTPTACEVVRYCRKFENTALLSTAVRNSISSLTQSMSIAFV